MLVGNLKLITVISIPKELVVGKKYFFNLDIKIRIESFKLVLAIKK